MTDKETKKVFYETLKAETKRRKIKLSHQGDIYKKVDPYFFHAFHYFHGIANGKANFTISICVKYHRFDEIHYNIIHPQDDFHFTDKIRANSTAHCPAQIAPRFQKEFECDGTMETVSGLAALLLDFLTQYIHDFLEMVIAKYGDLNEYYIANKDNDPYLAAIAYIDRGDYDHAAECFMLPNIGGNNLIWSVDIKTEEQRRRALANGITRNSFSRSQNAQYKDYAIALKKGLEWTSDRAFYGLLPEERDR